MTRAAARIRKKPVVLSYLAQAVVAAVLIAPLSCGKTLDAPPVAAAGDDLSEFAGYPVLLDGGASEDPEGAPLAYSWQMLARPQGSAAEVRDPETRTPSLTPDLIGEYRLSLAVSDGRSWSRPATVTVTAKPWFTRVTDSAGLGGGPPQNFRGPEAGTGAGMGPGASWGDYDNDGYPDLYVTGDGRTYLYRNDGDGTFSEVTSEAGIVVTCNAYGSAWGDYDRDDDLDLYVVCHGPDEENSSFDHQATDPNYLYRNNGDGTFTNVARAAGVDYIAHGSSASWVDFEKDGYLDLYLANFGVANMMINRGKADRNVLYRNNGDGTFTDVAAKVGVAGPDGPFDASYEVPDLLGALTFGGLWLDFDNDGDQDLLECSDIAASPLYQNNGDGTFTDVTKAVGLYLRGNCMGADSGDYDRDGFLDVYYNNYGPMRGDYLWRNEGGRTFTQVAEQAGVSDLYVGWGVEFVDFDNDGWLDAYMVNGLVGVSAEETGMDFLAAEKEPDFLYRNNGDGTFTDVTALADFGDDRVGRGSAAADYDNDGDLDVYVVNADGPDVLYRNEIGNGNNWLKLKFKGVQSNSGGVSVRVRLDAGEWSQIKEVKTGNSYLAGNEPTLHFGLGRLSKVKGITVTWPSGVLQTISDVPANQTVTIAEGM